MKIGTLAALAVLATVVMSDSTKDCPTASYCMALDESNSLSEVAFAKQTSTAVAFAKHIFEHAPGSFLSAVSFTTIATTIQTSTQKVNLLVSSLQSNLLDGGGTNIGAGLAQCQKLLAGAAEPRVVILFSNGESGKLTGVAAANKLKDEGITVAVLGVNIEPKDTSLDGVATSPALNQEIDTYKLLEDFADRHLHKICDSFNVDEELCKGSCANANICYVVDESGSIRRDDFRRQANVLVGTTSVYEALAPGSLYGVAGYADRAHVVQAPTFDTDLVMDSILRNRPVKGGSASGYGMKLCEKMLEGLSGPKLIVLVTDGKDNKEAAFDGVTVQKAIKQAGISIVTVGVGRAVDVSDLLKIASEHKGEKYFTAVKNYRVFAEAIGHIVQHMCSAANNWKTGSGPAGCGDVWCGRCGTTLECYADNKSDVTNARACRAMLAPGVCGATRKQRSKCRQTCSGSPPVTCYEGEMFGKRVDGAMCKTKGPSGEDLFPKHFGKYVACESQDGILSNKCGKRLCNADRPACWPLANL